MKHFNRVLLMAIALLALQLSQRAIAQEAGRVSIFDALEAWQPGSGVVIITQSPEIKALVGHRQSATVAKAKIINGYAHLSGYRIQAYSGNLRNSKAIATERRNQIYTLYPELMPTIEYDAPFWRVRLGNFVDQNEAQAKMQELQKAFPAFAREMYIVRSQVRVSTENL